MEQLEDWRTVHSESSISVGLIHSKYLVLLLSDCLKPLLEFTHLQFSLSFLTKHLISDFIKKIEATKWGYLNLPSKYFETFCNRLHYLQNAHYFVDPDPAL